MRRGFTGPFEETAAPAYLLEEPPVDPRPAQVEVSGCPLKHVPAAHHSFLEHITAGGAVPIIGGQQGHHSQVEQPTRVEEEGEHHSQLEQLLRGHDVRGILHSHEHHAQPRALKDTGA